MTGMPDDRYLPVMQNIETVVTVIYRDEDIDLTDSQVDRAYEMLQRGYQAELREKNPPLLKLNGPAMTVYEAVRDICEIHLGRGDAPEEIAILTVEEIVDVLKRLRKSIKLWTKEYGRVGYLDYIGGFIG